MTTTLPASPPIPAPAACTTGPRWVGGGSGLVALLAGTALLYLVDLGASGWANTFYSAAAQAGATSWKAFFFGSSDAANSIMVDKPPASLWVMELSARIFGVNPWSILVPQALEGVAAVGVLYAAVRRWHGPGAGLLAGATLALTPVAALMFRFNNPDALLVLLLTVGAYALVRALEAARTGWLLAAGASVGFAFLAKSLQAFLVVPAFVLVYRLAAPTGPRRRATQLLAAGVALVVTGGWWVAIVELIPAADRPYVGGSQTDSVLELIFGYNGFGRLTGNETGRVGGPPGGGGGAFGGGGITQLVTPTWGGQIAWLLPAALLLFAALLWLSRRAPRGDRLRTSALLWGGWLLVTAAVLSFGQGIIHPYYTVALAPPIGALVGVGALELWRRRAATAARMLLAGTVAVTAMWAWVLLARTPDFAPWLRVAVLTVGLVAAGGLCAGSRLPRSRLGRRLGVAVAGAALLTGLAGPAAYALDTAASPHGGAIPSAGPSAGFGPGRFRGGPGRFGRGPGGSPSFGPFRGGPRRGGFGAFPGGPPAWGRSGAHNGPRGGIGGLLDGSTPSAQLAALLQADATRYTWVAAAVGSNTAAGYQLATGDPVMAVGGFNGTDPSPTLEQFQRYVAQGKIHYMIGGGGFGRQSGGAGTSRQIAAWVAQHFTARTIDGVTIYDLTTT
ncbi:MAG: glycosyltransferase family 39 protein [Pseudonocardiales bacterium]|nr:glycosyltransferase family 39 protein [Pseudonocardiales bacterium]MBV9031544.1 glycosyltransferase family 39 protein [Pseudonocardiales bacterium]MBW0010830.1 glycosyltransferase family 39 protein [Pseudonocardiales bacterium]